MIKAKPLLATTAFQTLGTDCVTELSQQPPRGRGAATWLQRRKQGTGGSGTCLRSQGQEAAEPADALTIQGGSRNPSAFTSHSQRLLVWGGLWDEMDGVQGPGEGEKALTPSGQPLGNSPELETPRGLLAPTLCPPHNPARV